jgi:ribose/xylose/arabinose/galactoside ABC-type transport system permease subunit
MINSEKIKLGLVEHLIWLIILGVFMVFSLTIPHFFTIRNILFILYAASPLGFLVFGEAIALLSGNMDLSLSENAGLTAMLVGVILVDWAPWLPGWVGIILMVLVGALLGAVNGFFVGKMKINPFLITLSTFIMFNWSTYYLRRGVIVKVPAALLVLGGGKTGGIFNSIFVLVGMVFILYILLEHTRFGSHIKAIGGNSEASGMLGISVENTNFWIFTISGALAGISGLLYVGYLKCIPSTIADGAIFLAFAGAIMGGVSLQGGRGSIIGALGGLILMGIIDAGCTMTAMEPALRGVLNGFILLIAILINRTRESLRDRILMPK